MTDSADRTAADADTVAVEKPQPVTALEQVSATIERLISADGCAWHQAQTHASLTPFLVEEAAELVEAIDQQLPAAELISELGDVLYQVLLHSSIAERDGEGFGINTVADQLDAKLKARHPHVFGDRGYLSIEELNAEWERLKEDANGQKRGTRGVLEGIPAGMPTLAKAAKSVNRLAQAGLWESPTVPVTNSAENTESNQAENSERTVAHAARHSGQDGTDISAESAAHEPREAEIGIALLQLVEQAHTAGVDPDRALRVQLARHAAHLTEKQAARNMEE